MDATDFPRLLDAQYAGYREDIPFWLALACRQGGPILELGCGTGRVMRALIADGHEVVGLDRDAPMLAWARTHLPPATSARFRLVRGDLRSFEVEGPFPLVIIPCNTFAGLDDEGAASTLASAHRYLVPGGILAIDLPNPGTALSGEEVDGEPLTEFIEPETGHPCQLFAAEQSFPGERRIRVQWAYHELLPDGTRRILEVQTDYHLREEGDMRALVARSGFPEVDFHGDYEFGPYLPTSERMVAVAVKR